VEGEPGVLIVRHTVRRPADLVALAQRTTVVAAVVTGFVAILAMIIVAGDVFLLAFAGILLSVFLRGLANIIASHTRLSYGLALAVVVIGLAVGAAGVVFMLAPSVISQAHDLRRELPDAFDRLRTRIEDVDWLNSLAARLPSPEKVISTRADVWARITGFFSTALGLLTDVVVIVFIGLYVSVAPNLYRRGVLALVPFERRNRAVDLLSNLDHTLWWWLIAKLIAMVIVGALTAIGLWTLEVPAPIALGVVAAVLTFIPNFGPVLSAAPAILLALTEGLRTAGFVVLLYIAIQAIESYLITPNIEKKTINLPPALTISAQLLMGIIAGGLGLLVATPVCATALVLVRDLYVEQGPRRAPQ
jgi:predicted PurR-regulated permease PerM